MIVWGGCLDTECRTLLNDGAAYDPYTNTWRMIADSPLPGRSYHLSEWTGSEMLIVGGSPSERTAAAYSPERDSWRLLPDAPFGVGYEHPDGSVHRDYSSGVWANDRYVVWSPHADQVAAYSQESDSWTVLPATGLDVDFGVLRWNGADLLALGALSSVYPDRVPLQTAKLGDHGWEPLPSVEMWDDTYNIGASPYLSGWAGDLLVTFTDSGIDAGRTMAYRPGADRWTEIDPVPLSGEKGWPEPLAIGNRLLVFHHSGGAIYDSDDRSWTRVNTPLAEAGSAVWTGREVLAWATVGAPPNWTHVGVSAWRYTPPES